MLEGGSDSPLKYIFIKSIAFGSPAFHSGLFARGDQLVMVGDDCLIGMSLLQAKRVLERALGVVEVVAQRKEPVKQSPTLTRKRRSGNTSSEVVPPRGGTTMEEVVKKETIVEEGSPDVVVREEDRGEEWFSESLPPRRVSRSTSHSDIWMDSSVAMSSTSLGYAALSNANLSTSWNITSVRG